MRQPPPTTMLLTPLTTGIFLLLLLGLPLLSSASTLQVFVLHSYSQEYPWTSNQHKAFVKTLRSLSKDDLLFSSEYLDTKRRPLNDDYAAGFERYLRQKYQGYQPDLIYLTDDNALRFARQTMPELFPGVPIVFSGVNDYTTLNWLDRELTTGVYEKKEVAPNLHILSAALHNGEAIAFVGDNSATDIAIRHEIVEELQPYQELNPDFISHASMDELLKQLTEKHYRALILTTIGGLKDSDGNTLPLAQSLRRLAASGDFILLSMEDAYLYPGVMGGFVTSGHKQGHVAATLAARILAGEPLEAVSPVLKSPNEFIFEASELEKWRITLPEQVQNSAKILNAQPSFYQQNRKLILGSLFVLAVLLFITMAVSVVLVLRKNRKVKHVANALHLQHEELLHTQHNLVEAQRIANMGSWSLDLPTNHLVWSDEIFRIFEMDQRRFKASYEAFLETIHPDDRDMVNQAYLNSLETKQAYEIQHRLKMPDGRVKHVMERCSTTYDEQGKPLRSVGTVQEITERVQAEQQMRQWAQVFESTIEGVLITDDQVRIIDVNRAFTEITGYSRDEVLGQHPNMRRSERHADQFYQEMWRSITETGAWSGEIWNRKKSGELSPEWLSITTLSDDSGTITNYIGVFTDISVLKRSEEKLEHLANHDPLTGLANRNLLHDRLERAISRAQRHNHRVTVLFLDLDRFKIINDTLGHAVGDQMLIEVSERMLSALRGADTLGRHGGDEFLAIIEGGDEPGVIDQIADRIRQSINRPFIIDGKELFIGVSIGISVYPKDGADAATLIRNADSAMYQAKKSGRNSVSYYDTELTQTAIQRMELDGALRRAIEKEEFTLYYQPKIELQSGRITGAEVLVRWLRDGEHLIGPDRFIPIAEETGLILPIGKWVLEESIQQMSRWQQNGTGIDNLAINLSAVQVQRGNIPELLKKLLASSKLDASKLEIEITESVLIEHPAQAQKTLSELHKLGVSLAMDDFGTGFSSLINLKQYPIDTIKIDRSFIRDLLTDPNDEAITRAVLAMGTSLDMTVVAEGVEEHEQADYLKHHGCNYVQGYYYGRPMPVEEFEAQLLAHPQSTKD